MKKILIIILIFSFNYAQEFGESLMQPNQESDLISIEDLSYIPLEKPIDPNTYILGPGDLLGVNIISTKNISLPLRINPIGDIMIPSAGILNINGISLSEARLKIREYIVGTYLKNASVNVTLLVIRKFKIQVIGAIHNPGYIDVTPIDIMIG